MILIGSNALKYWYEDYPHKTKDIDYLVDEIPNQKENNTEYHVIKPLLEIKDQIQENNILKPDVLYTLKLSHSFWNIHWTKTMYHINFLKNKNCKIIQPLFDKLFEYWCKKYSKRNVNFNIENDLFFKDNVKREYDHETLHNIIKYENEPLYNLIKIDKTKAKCEEYLFNRLDYKIQLRIVMEEAYVIALERYYIPNNINLLTSYRRALKDLSVRLSEIWFSKFIIENYYELYKPEINFVNKFKNYKNGKINCTTN